MDKIKLTRERRIIADVVTGKVEAIPEAVHQARKPLFIKRDAGDPLPDTVDDTPMVNFWIEKDKARMARMARMDRLASIADDGDADVDYRLKTAQLAMSRRIRARLALWEMQDNGVSLVCSDLREAIKLLDTIQCVRDGLRCNT